jgi:ribonuclease HI
VALVQEPYVGAGGTVAQSGAYRVVQCSLNRAKPVKAAILIFGDRARVIHDPQLVTETEAAVVLEVGKLRVGLVSLYYEGDKEIEPYIERTQAICNKLGTENIILGGDINAWSQWWGSERENERGEKYNAFLNEMDYHVLNVGDTPTFEEYRRGRMYTSTVDVTACSSNLLDKIRNWKVDRNLTTSDHNAITFSLVVGDSITPYAKPTTRRYNVKKVKWADFDRVFEEGLEEGEITTERIASISDGSEMEALIVKYTEAIEKACNSSMPLLGRWKGKATPSWWTDSLDQQKRDVLRKKRRIRNAAPIRVEAVVESYIEAKLRYTEMCQEAQTQSWKEFCSTQERESMWDGIYRVLRRTTGEREDCLLRGANGETLSPEESASLLANTFYPEDTLCTDNPFHRKLRDLVENRTPTQESTDDPPFTEAELEAVLRAQNPKKAPGPDGFTSDICARAIGKNRKVFMAIANKCLAIGYFPAEWKRAHVVILRKPGKTDYTAPKSYRPIGLLSILGKTVEKLIIGRLQWHFLPTLCGTQYGFLPQRGTEDALYDLRKHLDSELLRKKSVVVVSLDIEGAFDNAWWPALKHQLQARKCPRNLYGVIDSYLRDRSVTVHYAGSTSTRSTNKGCVQGSIGGPTFWNLILDPLLQLLSKRGVYHQAFADDCVLVFSSNTPEEMEDPINEVLADVVRWGSENKLNFAAHKTCLMLLTRKLKFNPPQITMSGTNLTFVDEIKYLGVTIDNRLNFGNHVKNICRKAASIYKQLACAAKVSWGLNGEIVRTLYVAVIEPIITYGAGAWADATGLQMNRKRLESLQRNFAQKIIKAHKTVSHTSALTLSGTLPLDLRIQEVASLYEAKKGFSVNYLPPDRRVEKKVKPTETKHPSTALSIGYELIENMDSETITRHQITGPQIFTDGSKIEGKVGAALTWWENGQETMNETFALDPACTVFQSELYALHRAVLRVRESGRNRVDILSDSRSSLELLANPKLTHPLAKAIMEDIAQIRAERRGVRLFWIRAHVGTEGNERADELAKTAAAKSAHPDYAEIPVSYIKRKIREETVLKWQDRYSSSSTGSVTKMFLPDADYKVVRGTKLTPALVQMMTGHGGFGEYLHRFGLKNSPGCVCDPEKSESVPHLLFECPQFLGKRQDLISETETNLTEETLPYLMSKHRVPLIKLLLHIHHVVTSRNANPTDTDTAQHQTVTQPRQTQKTTNTNKSVNVLSLAGAGVPGIRLKPVALFMDDSTERLGIAFCNDKAKTNVYLSPGLGALLNGSTTKISMRRKIFNELPEVTVGRVSGRLVRKSNKIVVLLCADDHQTEFEKMREILKGMVEPSMGPKKISVDAMAVGYRTGETESYEGALLASGYHEVVIYENRGQDLSYLKARTCSQNITPQTDAEAGPSTGSSKLQKKMAEQREAPNPQRKTGMTLERFGKISRAILEGTSTFMKRHLSMRDIVQLLADKEKSRHLQDPPNRSPRTRAQKGQIAPPVYRPVKEPRDHWVNAFTEFTALTRATRQINSNTCEKILQEYWRENWGLLGILLEEAGAAVYDNDTSHVKMGSMSGRYMAAYGSASGFVALEEQESATGGPRFATTMEDGPLVVVAKCTRIQLEDRILRMAEVVRSDLVEGNDLGDWSTPTIRLVSGVPGCGKTSWVIKNLTGRDVALTTTKEAAKELRERLRQSDDDRSDRVKTVASVLVNGWDEGDPCARLIADEALMNHFGAIVMVARLVQAKEVVLIGDENQLPFIDRQNCFQLTYTSPNTITPVTDKLLCTHRNPQDVAYALQEIYRGIYSSRTEIRSLSVIRLGEVEIPKTENTLYLTHTQRDKAYLVENGYGGNKGSLTLTIHEAQGLTFESVVVVRPGTRGGEIYKSVSHAVVAVSRHTHRCAYYTRTTEDDAIALLISKARTATTAGILDYNLRMAMWSRDKTVITKNIEMKDKHQ